MTRLLITGAAGNLGRVLTRGLADKGYGLLLSDVAPVAAIPDGARFAAADLADKDGVLALCEGIDAIVHFGAIASEAPFEAVLEANIRGTYHIFEGARQNHARVIFASSNHSIGFHERDEKLGEDCHFRADGFYGLSKAYGELLGRYYWDKHGVESASLRIGSCFAEPADVRQLKTWLSFADLVALVDRCLAVPALGCAVFWGVSDNAGKWWSDSAGTRIGFAPRDSADAFAGKVAESAADRDPVAARYQGGAFCAEGYSRSQPAPKALFPDER